MSSCEKFPAQAVNVGSVGNFSYISSKRICWSAPKLKDMVPLWNLLNSQFENFGGKPINVLLMFSVVGSNKKDSDSPGGL